MGDNQSRGSGQVERNHFVGVCDSCAEIYEAQTLIDDLEGVTFACKKTLCTGRVALRAASDETAFEPFLREARVSEFDDPSGLFPPRRYC